MRIFVWFYRVFGDMNDYDILAEKYKNSDVKPDKAFSILPTIKFLVDDLSGKKVIDLGCGSGFFTREFAKTATHVVGIDNAEKQIALAQMLAVSREEYRLGDIFTDSIPSSNLVCAPFILNYAENVIVLESLLKKIFVSLNPDGVLVAVIDLPSGKDLSKFGAKKTIENDRDGAPLIIELFNRGEKICTLHGYYFTQETVSDLLKNVGFQDIVWHDPIISQEGIAIMGKDFWEGYIENCELGYLTAIRK